MTNSAVDELYFSLVADEISRGTLRKGLWAKALSETEYDENKAKAAYLKLRVESLKHACPELPELVMLIEDRSRKIEQLTEGLKKPSARISELEKAWKDSEIGVKKFEEQKEGLRPALASNQEIKNSSRKMGVIIFAVIAVFFSYLFGSLLSLIVLTPLMMIIGGVIGSYLGSLSRSQEHVEAEHKRIKIDKEIVDAKAKLLKIKKEKDSYLPDLVYNKEKVKVYLEEIDEAQQKIAMS